MSGLVNRRFRYIGRDLVGGHSKLHPLESCNAFTIRNDFLQFCSTQPRLPRRHGMIRNIVSV